MWLRGFVVLLVVAMLAGLLPLGGQAASQASGATPDLADVTLTENDCSFLIQGTDDPRPRLGEIACGVLDAPENWNLPDGRRIQIRYVVLKSPSAEPLPDPVVYLEGGPGGSALTGVEAMATFFNEMRATRDVILFDQRGTRLSSPLRCAAYGIESVLLDDVAGDEAAEDAALPPLPADLGAPYEILQEARQEVAPAAAECAREIAASGVDLRQYNSIASANDTVALIRALGYDQYNLYGISYGTRLALVIMRDHPASGIRSVVLDSTFPPEIRGFERYPEEPHEVVIQLFADCALDPECSAAYPNLKERFEALLPRLREEPLVTADGVEVTDRDVIEVMQSLSQFVFAVPLVPLMIDELERGETATFVQIATGMMLDEEQAEEEPSDEEAAQAATFAGDAAAEIDPEWAATLSPARRFIFDLENRVSGLPEDEQGALFALLLHADKQAPGREALQALVRRGFRGPLNVTDRRALLHHIAALSEDDVREVFEVLEQTVTLLEFLVFGVSQPQFNSVECNEEVPFQSFENTVAVAQGLEIPALATGVAEGLAGQFAICEVWPSGRAPAFEAAPVASEVPTLILSGAYDLQTPVSWNKSAFVTLPNGVYVLVPMSGHGVITYSACAEQIAADFIADPVAMLDTSCVAELKPAWVLPGALPAATPAPAATPVPG